jgi:hypothetical protein
MSRCVHLNFQGLGSFRHIGGVVDFMLVGFLKVVTMASETKSWRQPFALTFYFFGTFPAGQTLEVFHDFRDLFECVGLAIYYYGTFATRSGIVAFQSFSRVVKIFIARHRIF